MTNNTLTPVHAIPIENGAEAFLQLLHTSGVKYIFLNPGSDLIPILEAQAKFKHTGRPTPDFVLCQHESLAMTAAQGYFMASDKPQVVMVHLDVGTQQIGGALHNAQRGNAGIVLFAGRPPWTFEGERRGGRNITVDFRTEQLDQAAIVRPYTKWDYDLRCNENIHHVVARAFQIANSEPHGPVYLTISRELLMEKMASVTPLSPGQFGPAESPQGDSATLEKAARILVRARNPIAITGTPGRHHQAVAPFVKLAESLAMRVVSPSIRVNFPTDHALWSESIPNELLKTADAILLVDTTVPYIPAQVKLKPEVKVIAIDIDPLKAAMPTYCFPADIRIHADSAKALPALYEAVAGALSAADKTRCKERLEQLKQEDRLRRKQWTESAMSQAKKTPLNQEWLAWCLGQEIGDDVLLVDEAITYWAQNCRHLRRIHPGTSFRADGSSLGWSLGCTLGVKLASPERTVVCLVGDGSFMYGYPTHAMWTAANYKAPFLTIVFNNEGYYTMDRILNSYYGPDNYFSKMPRSSATSFRPSPDYVLIARAGGAWAERITDPDRIRTAIREGLAKVKEGQPALLEMVMAR